MRAFFAWRNEPRGAHNMYANQICQGIWMYFNFQGIIKDEEEDGEKDKSSEAKETKTKEQLAEEERERML